MHHELLYALKHDMKKGKENNKYYAVSMFCRRHKMTQQHTKTIINLYLSIKTVRRNSSLLTWNKQFSGVSDNFCPLLNTMSTSGNAFESWETSLEQIQVKLSKDVSKQQMNQEMLKNLNYAFQAIPSSTRKANIIIIRVRTMDLLEVMTFFYNL